MPDDIIEVDHGYAALMADLGRIDDLTVEVGIFTKSKDARGRAVAKYAGVHEADYGWMRNTWDEQEGAHDRAIEGIKARLLAGEDPVEVMQSIGEMHKRAFIAKISSLGLVDTGLMMDSLVVRIRDRAAREAAAEKRRQQILGQKRINGRFAR